MANVPTTTQQVPAYLQKFVQQRLEAPSSVWAIPGGGKYGRLSIKGKVFTGVYMGERTPMLDGGGRAVNSFDVVFVKPRDRVSRKYYVTPWKDGENRPPDCSSIDGITPDPASPQLQASTCGECAWSKWRTAVDQHGNPTPGQRCQTFKLAAVLPSGDMENKDFGGPVLLQIPPTSHPIFRDYYKTQLRLGRTLEAIHTRLGFNPKEPHPQLTFDFAGFIDQDEMAWIEYWTDPRTDGGMYVDEMLQVPPMEVFDTSEDDAPDDQQPAVQAPVRAAQSIRQPVAQAQTRQASPQPAPTPSQGAPTRGAPNPVPNQVASTQPAPSRVALNPVPTTRHVAGAAPVSAPAPAPRSAPATAPQRTGPPPRTQTAAPVQALKPATRATQAPVTVRARPPVAGQAPTTVARTPAPRGNGQRPPAADLSQEDEAELGEIADLLANTGTDFDIDLPE